MNTSGVSSLTKNRLKVLLKHFGDMKSKKQQSSTHDELEELMKIAEEKLSFEESMKEEQEKQKISSKIHGDEIPVKDALKFVPYLIVPTFVEESTKSGQESRERRRQRINILYDVTTARAQIPAFLDVSQDDPKTPLAFRYIRIILLTGLERKAQDIHLDQYSRRSMSVVYVTQLGVTGRIIIKGAVVQSIIYYIAFYDLLTAGKTLPGAVRITV